VIETKIPDKYQTSIAWGLLVLFGLLVLLLIIIPLLNFTANQKGQLLKHYEKLASYQHVIDSSEKYERKYAHIQKNELDNLFYPQGLTSAQVGKELQKQLAIIIQRDKGRLSSSEVLNKVPLDDNEDFSYQKVIVKASLQGNVKLLRNLLHQAYRARPFIFIESLSIKPMRALKNTKQLIKADLVISTYWHGGGENNETMD
jgi:hypothetical protein